MADSRYTRATRLAQDDMHKIIDSFGEDTPFMSEGASARTEARKAKLASAPADIRGLLDQGFPQYFVERLLDGDTEKSESRRDVFVHDVKLDPSQVEDRRWIKVPGAPTSYWATPQYPAPSQPPRRP